MAQRGCPVKGALLVVLLGLPGCELFLVDRMAPGPASTRYAQEVVPARCVQAPPAVEATALDGDATRMLLAQRLDPISGGQVFRYSEDDGESWENLAVAGVSTTASTRTWTAWGGSPVITRVREDVWGILGEQWEVEGGTGRPLAVVTTDGGATWTQHLGDDGGATIDGIPADATYVLSDDEQIAVTNGITWASTDGGASWSVAGATHAWRAPLLDTRAKFDIVGVRDEVALGWTDSPFFDSDRGALLYPDATVPFDIAAMRSPHGAILPDGRVATLGGSGTGSGIPELQLFLTDPATEEARSFPLATALDLLALAEGADDRLWISGIVQTVSTVEVDREGEILTWRYDPATDQLTEVWFDIGHPVKLRVTDAVPRGDGARLFVAAPRWERSIDSVSFWPLLDGSRITWMCDVGPDITEGSVALEREGTPPDLEPGRVVVHAHRGTYGLASDGLALDGAGDPVVVTQVYGHGGSGSVRTGAPPSEALFVHQDASDGLWLWGTSGASAAAVGVLRGARQGESVVPRDQLLDRWTGATISEGELPVAASRAVYGDQRPPGDRLLVTDGRLISTGGAVSASPAEQVTFPKHTVVNGRHGVAVSDGNVAAREGAREGTSAYFRRFDATRGAIPEPNDCFEDPPPDCVALPEVMPAAVHVGLDGDLYVLDAMRGRVWFHAPGDAEWSVLATGFVNPADMVVRDGHDRTVVYVLDGHVWSFVAEPGVVAR